MLYRQFYFQSNVNMESDKQFRFSQNKLILSVKKTFGFVRLILGLLIFIAIAMMIGGMVMVYQSQEDVLITSLIMLVIYGLIIAFFARLFLWNTYGREIMTFEGGSLHYIADFKWFKDSEKHLEWTGKLDFSIKTHGQENSMYGYLIITSEKDMINCVTKIPIDQLKIILTTLESENLNVKPSF